MSWREQIFTVGEPNSLNGVLTLPDEDSQGEVALILLNSGLMHHVGTCNLSVKIARIVVQQGVPTCRFNFSGIGDSRARSFSGSHEEREVSEIQEVMDELSSQFGYSSFMLLGLCSGADAAFAAAKIDARVVGIVQIDPHCVRSMKWYFYKYYRKITDNSFWRRVYRRITGQKLWFDGLAKEFLEEIDGPNRHQFDKETFAAGYAQLVQREVSTLVIMTSGQKGCYNYEGQFREVFGLNVFGAALEEHYLKQTRHIISEPEDQILVTNWVKSWVSEVSSNRMSLT